MQRRKVLGLCMAASVASFLIAESSFAQTLHLKNNWWDPGRLFQFQASCLMAPWCGGPTL